MNPFQNKILHHLPVLSSYVGLLPADNKPPFAHSSTRQYPPIQVEIDLTNSCVSACPWCAGYLDRPSSNAMLLAQGDTPADRLASSIAGVLSLLEDLSTLGVKSIVWTGGGDPTSHRGLQQVIERASSLGLQQALITHGVIDVSHLIHMVEWVRFSVDASNADDYGREHGKPEHFARVLENVKAAVRRKQQDSLDVTVGVACIVHYDNHHDIIPFTRIWKDIPVDYIQYRPLQDTHSQHFFASNEDTLSYVKLAQLEDCRVVFHTEKFQALLYPEELIQTIYCHGQYMESAISADSNVYPCCHLKGDLKYSIGNLMEESFSAIWERHLDRLSSLGPFQTVPECPSLCRHFILNKFIDRNILKDVSHPNFI